MTAFLALAVAGLTSQDAQLVRAAYLAMELTGWFVIVPFGIATLVTGLVQALGTPWGLFRHYWVLFKLLITVFSTALFAGAHAAHDPPCRTSRGDLRSARMQLVGDAGAALLALLVATALSVYKPLGMTPYGQRRSAQGLEAEQGRGTRTPPWVYVFAIVAGLCSKVVVNLYHAIRKRFHGTECQRHIAMPQRDEGSARPNEDWYNSDNEFVDRVFVQKRRDELPATHHPDVLARLIAEAFGKRTDRLRDELDAGRHGRRWRPAREHIVPVTGFSHAVGIVEFVLEQSRYQFGAAVVIDSNINSYLADALHDGRPASGPALEPREFARDLNAEKIHAPLLLEAHGIPTAVGMFSVFNGLRLAHRPTELQYYLEEDHDLVSPASQMSALTRQIDWYRFWLKSEEDPVPSKALQYARWRKLKELQQ